MTEKRARQGMTPTSSTYSHVLGKNRVGLSEKSNLQWVLRFVETNLARLNSEEKFRLKEDIVVFILMGIESPKLLSRYGKFSISLLLLPIDPVVERIHKFTSKVIRELLGNKLTKLPEIRVRHEFFKITPFVITPKATIVKKEEPLFPWQDPFANFDGRGKYIGPTWRHQKLMEEEGGFINRLATVLHEAGEYLAQCSAPDCGAVYVKSNQKKEFCAPRCRLRIAMRGYRKQWKRRANLRKTKRS